MMPDSVSSSLLMFVTQCVFFYYKFPLAGMFLNEEFLASDGERGKMQIVLYMMLRLGIIQHTQRENSYD